MEILTQFNPEVRLVNAFSLPYDNAVATARTCYSSKVVYSEDVNKDESSRQKRDIISKSIYLAGHHTTLQHSTFQFILERVSRQCIWSFLHSHPFYNSEQVSQRYVAVSKENFAVPPLTFSQQKLYIETVHLLMNAYSRLQGLLQTSVENEYQSIFPMRNLKEKRWQSVLKKKTQEVARYVLPLATYAHLYHTISGLTLLRYWRLCQIFDAPTEQKVLVEKMVQAVQLHDPNFFKNAEDPLALEQTPEYAFFQHPQNLNSIQFNEEFDHSMQGKTSHLLDYKINAEKVMAQSVRSMFGLRFSELGDEQAIASVMNPAFNSYLSDTLNLTHHAKLTRAMVHPHFTFRKKISHTADSQDQRHRTVPGSRPVLSRHFSNRADYITPLLIQKNKIALEFYEQTFSQLWKNIEVLMNDGLSLEFALYLLPNAFPVRFEESGSLLDFHHKWIHRLCYTAQEEIWKNCLEEVQQVQQIHPFIGKYLAAPCTLRKMAGRKPYCPEGDRFCGEPVWTKTLDNYHRVI